MLPPLLLLADSQLLFSRAEDGAPFLSRVHELAGRPVRSAAYLGASNGDLVEYFELFAAAMVGIDVPEQRHVLWKPTPDDAAFLARADLVLLAGGDPAAGLRAFDEGGLRQLVVDAYVRGAIVVGVSAGAVQLGLAIPGPPSGAPSAPACFGMVPAIIDAHDEPDWARLRASLSATLSRGVGIPSGGGAIYHRDGSLEPVRRPLLELRREGELTREALIIEGAPAARAPDPSFN